MWIPITGLIPSPCLDCESCGCPFCSDNYDSIADGVQPPSGPCYLLVAPALKRPSVVANAKRVQISADHVYIQHQPLLYDWDSDAASGLGGSTGYWDGQRVSITVEAEVAGSEVWLAIGGYGYPEGSSPVDPLIFSGSFIVARIDNSNSWIRVISRQQGWSTASTAGGPAQTVIGESLVNLTPGTKYTFEISASGFFFSSINSPFTNLQMNFRELVTGWHLGYMSDNSNRFPTNQLQGSGVVDASPWAHYAFGTDNLPSTKKVWFDDFKTERLAGEVAWVKTTVGVSTVQYYPKGYNKAKCPRNLPSLYNVPSQRYGGASTIFNIADPALEGGTWRQLGNDSVPTDPTMWVGNYNKFRIHSGSWARSATAFPNNSGYTLETSDAGAIIISEEDSDPWSGDANCLISFNFRLGGWGDEFIFYFNYLSDDEFAYALFRLQDDSVLHPNYYPPGSITVGYFGPGGEVPIGTLNWTGTINTSYQLQLRINEITPLGGILSVGNPNSFTPTIYLPSLHDYFPDTSGRFGFGAGAISDKISVFPPVSTDIQRIDPVTKKISTLVNAPTAQLTSGFTIYSNLTSIMLNPTTIPIPSPPPTVLDSPEYTGDGAYWDGQNIIAYVVGGVKMNLFLPFNGRGVWQGQVLYNYITPTGQNFFAEAIRSELFVETDAGVYSVEYELPLPISPLPPDQVCTYPPLYIRVKTPDGGMTEQRFRSALYSYWEYPSVALYLAIGGGQVIGSISGFLGGIGQDYAKGDGGGTIVVAADTSGIGVARSGVRGNSLSTSNAKLTLKVDVPGYVGGLYEDGLQPYGQKYTYQNAAGYTNQSQLTNLLGAGYSGSQPYTDPALWGWTTAPRTVTASITGVGNPTPLPAPPYCSPCALMNAVWTMTHLGNIDTGGQYEGYVSWNAGKIGNYGSAGDFVGMDFGFGYPTDGNQLHVDVNFRMLAPTYYASWIIHNVPRLSIGDGFNFNFNFAPTYIATVNIGVSITCNANAVRPTVHA